MHHGAADQWIELCVNTAYLTIFGLIWWEFSAPVREALMRRLPRISSRTEPGMAIIREGVLLALASPQTGSTLTYYYIQSPECRKVERTLDHFSQADV